MPVKFGQNFLTDVVWQKRIVDWFQPQGLVVEIGPGRGALTQHLQKKYSDFLVIEIDKRLKEIHEGKNYRLLSMDFMKWDFCLDDRAIPELSFISNLPYDVGTKILTQIVLHYERVPHFVFMLQKEVAERVCAQPGIKDFGSLSILVQSAYEIELMATLPPGAFTPKPKVFSSVIRGRRRAVPLTSQEEGFRSFIRNAFLFKRKTLANALKNTTPKGVAQEALAAAGIPANARAEQVDLLAWDRLYKEVQQRL